MGMKHIHDHLKRIHRITGHEWIQHSYYTLLYASYALYAIVLFGISRMDPTYLSSLNTVLKYLIIAVLMARFNPWIENKSFTEFDRSVVFSAAFFLLTTTAITSLVLNALHLPNAH